MKLDLEALCRVVDDLEEAGREMTAKVDGLSADVDRLEQEVGRLNQEMQVSMDRLKEIVDRLSAETREAKKAAESRGVDCRGRARGEGGLIYGVPFED